MRRSVVVAGTTAFATVAAAAVTVMVGVSANASTSESYEAEASGNVRAGTAAIAQCAACSGGAAVDHIGQGGELSFSGVKNVAHNSVLARHKARAAHVRVSYLTPEQRQAVVTVNGGRSITVTFPATSGGKPGTLDLVLPFDKDANTVKFANPDGAAPEIDRIQIGNPRGTHPAPTAPLPSDSPTDSPTAQPGSPSAQPGATETATRHSPTKSATSTPTKQPVPSTADTSGSNVALEDKMIELMNVERAKVGCAALKPNAGLAKAARAHSALMAARQEMTHRFPDEADLGPRIAAAGYQWGGLGENITAINSSADAALNYLMDDEEHRGNIINCGFKDVGIGAVLDKDGQLWWTQDFGSPL